MQAALKLCSQALTKYPGQPLFTVLKAFALDRSGNGDAATPLIQFIIDCDSACSETVQHASTLLKSRNDVDKLAELYEKATKRQPHDNLLQQQLFVAYAQQGSAVKQQQVAMKLNKKDPQELSAMWVVCSVLSQAAARRAGATHILP